MLEKELEKVLKNAVKKAGGLAIKITSPGLVGVPDRLVLLPCGGCFFVELKSDGGRLSASQKAMIERIKNLEQKVYVLKGKSELLDFIHFEIFKGEKL